jgi:glycosyltransferase involved in cell wall biosynthesis
VKIAYLCYWDLARGDGVSRKIAGQARLWRQAGHDVEVVSIRPGRRREETGPAVETVERFGPELLYLRYDLFLPAVWRLVRRVPAVVEVNSDDRAELRARGFAPRLYNALNRRRIFGPAAGVVCPTRELAARFPGAAVVANGADPDAVPSLPAPANERPRAVFAGSPRQPWHGVDRLLELARALPDVDFDLVGPEPRDPPANVTLHGTLAGDAYWAALTPADVAVGSLAMERAGLREGSPLKVREYLLAGIPTVIGYDDTDFPGELPWYLARYENAVQLRAFVDSVRRRRAPRDELEPRLSWQAKERERLAYFERVLG